jgi:hypothetical protein
MLITTKHCFHRFATTLVCAAALTACGGGGDDAPAGGSPAPQEPPPWGSLTLTGGGAVARTLPSFKPNRVPFTSQSYSSALHTVLWSYDNLWDARTTVAEPAVNNSGTVLITTDVVTPSGPFIGALTVGFFLNAPDAASPPDNAVLNCGGGTGAFAGFSRDAACDRITWNATSRTVRFDNVPLAGINSTANGELSYPAFSVNTGTTGRATQWNSCPAPTTDIVPLSWSNAQCLNGTYVGVSDGNRACRVTIDATAQTARVEIDGYTQTYRFGLGYEATERDVNGVLEKTWEYYFGTTANAPTGQEADALLVSLGTPGLLRLADASRSTGLAFGVQHTTAPAGVAGPVDTKWCIAPVAN